MNTTDIIITHHYRLDDPLSGPIVTAQLVYAGGNVAVIDPRTNQRVIVGAGRLYPVCDITHVDKAPKGARTPKKPKATVGCGHYWQVTYEWREGRLVQIGRCQHCQAEREFKPKFHVSAVQPWDLTKHHNTDIDGALIRD